MSKIYIYSSISFLLSFVLFEFLIIIIYVADSGIPITFISIGNSYFMLFHFYLSNSQNTICISLSLFSNILNEGIKCSEFILIFNS